MREQTNLFGHKQINREQTGQAWLCAAMQKKEKQLTSLTRHGYKRPPCTAVRRVALAARSVQCHLASATTATVPSPPPSMCVAACWRHRNTPHPVDRPTHARFSAHQYPGRLTPSQHTHNRRRRGGPRAERQGLSGKTEAGAKGLGGGGGAMRHMPLRTIGCTQGRASGRSSPWPPSVHSG